MVEFSLWAGCAVGPIPEGLGVAGFFPRLAEEVFDRHSLVLKTGACICLSTGWWHLPLKRRFAPLGK